MQLANNETASDMSYVDASGLTLSDMGSMGGGFGGGMPGGSGGTFPGQASDGTARPSGDSTETKTERPFRDNTQMPEAFSGNGMGNTAAGGAGLLLLAASILILAMGLVIAKFYQR